MVAGVGWGGRTYKSNTREVFCDDGTVLSFDCASECVNLYMYVLKFIEVHIHTPQKSIVLYDDLMHFFF